MKNALADQGIKLPLSTVHRYILALKGKLAKWHVKVYVNAEQMEARKDFVTSQIVPGTDQFRNMDNDVHVDEKWFFLIMENGYFLVFEEDELPAHYARHKNDIVKVMFLCAVCKPQLRPDGSRMNGLIACESFTKIVPAQRDSVNRRKGTLEEKPITVTADVYRDFMVRLVIPKIRTRLNWKKGELITIRHDGAKPHNGKGNAAYFARYLGLYGWNMKLETQSPQSPDVNVLDIGIFNGLQSKSEVYRTDATSVSDLVKRVKKTFSVYPMQQLTSCFAVLLEHYRSILMCDGGNKYPDPHCGIRRRVAKGLDPCNYSINFDDGYDTDDEVEG